MNKKRIESIRQLKNIAAIAKVETAAAARAMTTTPKQQN